jgi:hypothetical protein
MAETTLHLRLIDQPPRFAGESKYRSGEGWIDVRAFSFQDVGLDGRPSTDKSFQVACGFDRVMTLIYQACESGAHIRSAVLMVRKDAQWVRHVLEDVVITSFATSEPWQEKTFTFAATYKQRSVSSFYGEIARR